MITTEVLMELRDIKRRSENEMKEDLEKIYLLITKNQEIDDNLTTKLSCLKDRIEDFLIIEKYERLERLFEGRD